MSISYFSAFVALTFLTGVALTIASSVSATPKTPTALRAPIQSKDEKAESAFLHRLIQTWDVQSGDPMCYQSSQAQKMHLRDERQR